MPRSRPLPDISDVDLAQLQLEILAMLDRVELGPEVRQLGHIEFGDALDRLGGARLALMTALAACRRGS
jgi:hypothetical protein